MRQTAIAPHECVGTSQTALGEHFALMGQASFWVFYYKERQKMATVDSVFTKDQADQAIIRLEDLGLKARLQVLKHPGMEGSDDSPETIRGFSVSVEISRGQITMAKGHGYRSAESYPAGFAWFPGADGRLNLVPYPGDSLDDFIQKLTTERRQQKIGQASA